MPRAPQLIIITDIDGTILDRDTYEAGPAGPVVATAVAEGVPVVLCSSKTRAEQRLIRRRLGIDDPYIVENGGAVVIPDSAFGPNTALPAGALRSGRNRIVALGRPAGDIRATLEQVRQELGLPFKMYSDLPREEVARLTGLDVCAAGRATQREYSETIVTPLSVAEVDSLRAALRGRGLAVASGGRFHTVTDASTDKGTAIALLLPLYRARFGEIVTIGLGDSENDLPLLAAVDRPLVVQQPDGHWHDFEGLDVMRVPHPGPAGWAAAVGKQLRLAGH